MSDIAAAMTPNFNPTVKHTFIFVFVFDIRKCKYCKRYIPHRIIIWSVFIWVYVEGGTQARDVREQSTDEGVWAWREGLTRPEEISQ